MLERQPETELHHALIVDQRACDAPQLTSQVRIDVGGVRIVEVRMVERVEGLHAQTARETFRKLDGFGNGQVDVPVAWTVTSFIAWNRTTRIRVLEIVESVRAARCLIGSDQIDIAAVWS